jgi:hypothetical protein
MDENNNSTGLPFPDDDDILAFIIAIKSGYIFYTQRQFYRKDEIIITSLSWEY